MKRIRCPKCDEPITFNNSLYEPGRTLVFECPNCRKQYKIKIPSQSRAADNSQDDLPVYGYLTVIENTFHYRQTILLHEGDNIVGRHVKGTRANAAIRTVDPSIDTTHCIINVQVKGNGNTIFTLRDAPSGTGTFLGNEILKDRDRIRIDDEAIITIGATTMIFHKGVPDEE